MQFFRPEHPCGEVGRGCSQCRSAIQRSLHYDSAGSPGQFESLGRALQRVPNLCAGGTRTPGSQTRGLRGTNPGTRAILRERKAGEKVCRTILVPKRVLISLDTVCRIVCQIIFVPKHPKTASDSIIHFCPALHVQWVMMREGSWNYSTVPAVLYVSSVTAGFFFA